MMGNEREGGVEMLGRMSPQVNASNFSSIWVASVRFLSNLNQSPKTSRPKQVLEMNNSVHHPGSDHQDNMFKPLKIPERLL